MLSNIINRKTIICTFFFVCVLSASTKTFYFDVRNYKTNEIYTVIINLSSKTIDVNKGHESIFKRSFITISVLDDGIAFAFNERDVPSLRVVMTDWFFFIKPSTIGFYNYDTKTLVKADPINIDAFTATYNKLVSEIKNDKENDIVSHNQTGSNIIFTVKDVSFTMIYVQGGTFIMGTADAKEDDVYNDEKPAHEVNLSSFYIGQTEVTQELWNVVMGNNPSIFNGGKLPVEFITWNDCIKFIDKLNNLTGRRFRLPTEAEWEYAARGGIKSKGYKYAGSDSLNNVAWYWNNSGDKFLEYSDNDWSEDIIRNNNDRTHVVARKNPNELDIYDMSGNVYEWCNDRYDEDYYSHSPSLNPQGASSGSKCVLRGGSYNELAECCRVTFRGSFVPDKSAANFGFRLALSF